MVTPNRFCWAEKRGKRKFGTKIFISWEETILLFHGWQLVRADFTHSNFAKKKICDPEEKLFPQKMTLLLTFLIVVKVQPTITYGMKTLPWLTICKIQSITAGRPQKPQHETAANIVSTVRKQREKGECQCSSHFLLVQDSITWNDATEIQNGSSHFNFTNLDTALEIFPVVFLLGNVESCHVDIITQGVFQAHKNTIVRLVLSGI